MKIGVDFGTTRVVVAAADRGNYPVVAFEAPDGETRDWFPPVVAVKGDERRYGFEAWQAQEESGWTVVRSVKRLLGEAGLHSTVAIGEQTVPLQQILYELVESLCRALRERSTLTLRRGEPLEAMLGVPANANSNQRFLTAEGFRRAGVQVIGLLNEPSAASIEFGHRLRLSGDAVRRRLIVVYDFGGGTFDASLVDLDDQVHEVRDTEGLVSVGGDDFDELLAELALEAAGAAPAERDALSQATLFRLLELCRRQKEAIHPNTRRLIIDLDSVAGEWTTVTIPIAEYYSRSQPLVDATIEAVDRLLERNGLGQAEDVAVPSRRRLDSVYITGGASDLPLVGRRLRERYGRLVRRSAYGRSATAIGLAIQADAAAGYQLRDRFTRFFGVWREGNGGASAVFDPLFVRGTPLPAPGDPPLETARQYRPAHNLGHFRFLECSQLGPQGEPAGDILHWDEIRFPFTPDLHRLADLSGVVVQHDPAAAQHEIRETCRCEASGSVVVTLSNLTANYSRSYALGHWGARSEPIKPGRRRARR